MYYGNGNGNGCGMAFKRMHYLENLTKYRIQKTKVEKWGKGREATESYYTIITFAQPSDYDINQKI